MFTMEMVKHLARYDAGAMHPELLEEKSLEQIDAANKWLEENLDRVHPLGELVGPDEAVHVIGELQKIADQISEINRRRILSVVQFLLEPGNYKKSKVQMCQELGINYLQFQRVTTRHRFCWHFINKMIIYHGVTEAHGRIVKATVDSAVDGDHRDRRLYFELIGAIRRAGGASSHGGVHITFVQDALNRPQGKVDQPPVLDIKVTED